MPESSQATPKFFQMSQRLAARKDLSPAAKLVYIAIADRVRDNGHSWPSYERIAADVAMTKRGVIGLVDRLKAKGLLAVVGAERPENSKAGAGPGRGKSNSYYLTPALKGERHAPLPEGLKGERHAPEKVNVVHPNRRREKTNTSATTGAPPKSVVGFDKATATFTVPEELLTRWKGKYPALDVDGEIAKAGEYHDANTGKRRWKPGGYRAALVNWLNRATTPRPGPGGGKARGGQRPARHHLPTDPRAAELTPDATFAVTTERRESA